MQKIAICFLLCWIGYTQGQCEQENFQIIEIQVDRTEYFEDSIEPGANVYYPEDSSVGPLYALKWTEGTLMSIPIVTSGEPQWVQWDMDLTNNSIEFSLIEDITGIMDYGDEEREDSSYVSIEFQFIRCSVTFQIQNLLEDVNTQTPKTNQPSYDVIIREDYPLFLPIYTLEVYASDLDADEPNTLFEASLNVGCPMTLGDDEYSCEKGVAQLLEFVLQESLDYEMMQEVECILTLKDKGEPSLSSETTINIEVLGYPDEVPKFSELSYEGQVFSVDVDSRVDVNPAIEAIDGDDPETQIIYSIQSTDSGVFSREYFRIDEKSAEVFVNRELDDEYLLNEFVSYIITATDGDGQSSTAFLLIELPSLITTTESPETTRTSSSSDSSISSEISTDAPSSTKSTYSTSDTDESTYSTSDTDESTPSTSDTDESTKSTSDTDESTPSTSDTDESTHTTSDTDESTHSTSDTDESTSERTTTEGLFPSDGQFDQDKYTFQIYHGASDVGIIHAESTSQIQYFWSESSNSDNFNLDKNSGEITTSIINSPVTGEYKLQAECRTKGDDKVVDVTDVVILVSEIETSSLPIFDESIYQTSIKENGDADEDIVIVTADGGSVYCLQSTRPDGLEEFFLVDKATGQISTSQSLDADIYEELLKLKISAFRDDQKCPELDKFEPNIERNEALVVITVEDENDNKPFFVDSTGEIITEWTVAFPENILLQSTLGLVTQLQALDGDKNSSLTFQLGGTTDFVVDENTGVIFCSGECMDSCAKNGCELTPKITDGDFSSELQLTILPLPLENVFTFADIMLSEEELDSELQELSAKTGVEVQKLYTEVTSSGKTERSSQNWKLDVHVYVLDGESILSLEDFNVLLEEADYPTASEFSRISLYEGDNPIIDPGDDTNVGLIVGLSIMAIAFLVAVAVGIYLWIQRKRLREEVQIQKNISTLGSIYPTVKKPSVSTNSSVSHKKPSISTVSSTKTSFSLYSEHKPSVDNDDGAVLTEFSAVNSNVDMKGIDNPVYQEETAETLDNVHLPRTALQHSMSSASSANDSSSQEEVSSTENEETKSVSFKVLVDARIIHQDPSEHDSDTSVYL